MWTLILIMALSYAHGAIEWLNSATVGTVYTVSGLGFQPKAIRFYKFMHSAVGTDVSSDTSNTINWRSIGFATSTTDRRCVGTFDWDGQGSMDCASAYRIDAVVVVVDTGGVAIGLLDINSITSGGFTLMVDDPLGVSSLIFWEAWGGTDLTVNVIGEIAEPAATGDVDYTVTGFTATDSDDQCVMFAGVQTTAAAPAADVTDSGFCVGFATGGAAAENIVVVGNQDDGSASADTDGYCKTGECLAMITIGGGNPNARAQLTQFNADGFRLNWIARGVTDRRYIFLAIKGGSWRAGSYTIDGATGGATAVVSGLPFTPKGVSLIGRLSVEQVAGLSATEDIMSLGSGSSTSSRRAVGYRSENAGTNAELDGSIEFDQVLAFPSTTGTLLSAYDISAMSAGGFTIVVDVAGGPALLEWQGYLTYGDSSAGDTTAPILSSQTVSSVTQTGGTPQVTTDEGNGTAYMVVVPNGDSPSVTQIKAGQNSSGGAALASQNQTVTATGVQTFSAVTGLTANTAYDCWFVHTDAATNNSTAVKADFTTLAVGPLRGVPRTIKQAVSRAATH
jgi:hypothetical protein